MDVALTSNPRRMPMSDLPPFTWCHVATRRLKTMCADRIGPPITCSDEQYKNTRKVPCRFPSLFATPPVQVLY